MPLEEKTAARRNHCTPPFKLFGRSPVPPYSPVNSPTLINREVGLIFS